MRERERRGDVLTAAFSTEADAGSQNAKTGVAEAAVIGVRHPKWDERPLLVVVLKEGQSATKDELFDFMRGKVARWWLPDDVAFVKEIPHTATGKIQKTVLRTQFKDYELPSLADIPS